MEYFWTHAKHDGPIKSALFVWPSGLLSVWPISFFRFFTWLLDFMRTKNWWGSIILRKFSYVHFWVERDKNEPKIVLFCYLKKKILLDFFGIDLKWKMFYIWDRCVEAACWAQSTQDNNFAIFQDKSVALYSFLRGITFLRSSEFACVQYLRSEMLDYFIFSSWGTSFKAPIDITDLVGSGQEVPSFPNPKYLK